MQEIRKNRGWFVALGLILAALGLAVISASFYSTLFSVTLLGVFLAAAGTVQIVQAFVAIHWKGLFYSLLLGALYLVTGIACISKPAYMAANITVWISAFCFVVGIGRMLIALMFHFEKWGWTFANGLITFLIGAIIYFNWPISGLWIIGLFVGIEMIISGLSWILFSLKRQPKIG